MRIILLGPPGAGKGTQARILTSKHGVVQIAAGDLFRDNIKKGTDLGKQVEAIIAKGELVPDPITIKMIAERLDQDDCKKGFLLDGFPRNLAQAEALEKMLKEKGIKLDAVVQLAVDDEKLVERITGRFTCSDCGEGYHDCFKKPEKEDACDECGAEDSFTRRPDDNEESVRTRLGIYHEQTALILPYYKSAGLLKAVDGMKPMDEVSSDIEAALSPNQGSQKPPSMCL